MSTYRAAVLRGHRRVEIEDVQIPKVDEDDLLVRVEATNLCPTDVKKWADSSLPQRLNGRPLILGHELAGTVAAAGSSAAARFPEGTRIAVDPIIRHFPRSNASDKNKLLGIGSAAGVPEHNADLLAEFGYGGGLAEMVKIPASCAIVLPEDLTFPQGSLIEPVADAAHSVSRTERPVQDTDCVVFGLGAMGLMHVSLLAAHGARVVGIDPRSDRRDLALAAGAVSSVGADATPEFDNGFIAVGGAALTVAAETALRRIRDDGCLVFFSSTTPGTTLPVDINRVHYGRLRLSGVVGFTRSHAGVAISALAAGSVRDTLLRSPTMPFERVGEAFDLASRGEALKVGFDFHATDI